MRTTVAIGALLLLALSTAAAQVPRTINYQGRIVDAAGEAVNGERRIELRLYTSPTGGTPVFTEIHDPVTFKNGIFTAAIGGVTSGGIPESVPFDRPYWLGVTISQFNGGTEIVPRFSIRSSPYSLRAIVADSSVSAYSADSAGVARLLHTPATLDAGDTDEAALTLANGQGPALRAEGTGRYAIVSDGVDSTSQYFVAGAGVPGTQVPPAAGAYYRDNAPMAWAVVTSDGTIVTDFGVTSVGKPTDLGYEIRLDRPVAMLEFNGLTVPQCAPVISQGGSIPPGDARLRIFSSWGFKQESDGTLNPQVIMVRFIDAQALPTQAPFSIVIFGRPQ